MVVAGLGLLNLVWGFLRSSVLEAPGETAIPLGSVYHVVGWSPALLLLSGLAAAATLLPAVSTATGWAVSAAAAVTGGIGALFYLFARAGGDAALGFLVRTNADSQYEDNASIGLILLVIFGLLQLIAAVAGLAFALGAKPPVRQPRTGGPGNAYGPGASARQQHPAGSGRAQGSGPGYPPPGQQPPPQYAQPGYPQQQPGGSPPPQQYAQPEYASSGQQPQYGQPAEYAPSGQQPQYIQPEYAQPEYVQPGQPQQYAQPEYAPSGQPPQYAQPDYPQSGRQPAPQQSPSGYPGYSQPGYPAQQPEYGYPGQQPVAEYQPQPVYDPQSGREVFSGQAPAAPTAPTRVPGGAAEPAASSVTPTPAPPEQAAESAPAEASTAQPEYARTDYGSADYVWEPTYSEAPEYEAKADEEADAPPVAPRPERAFMYETPEWERPQFEPPRLDTGRHPGWDAGYAEAESGAEGGATEAGSPPPGHGPHYRSIPRAE